MVYIEVRDGNLDAALRFIRRKLQRDGSFKLWKDNTAHKTEGEKNRKKRYESLRKISKKGKRGGYAFNKKRSYSSGIASELPLHFTYKPEDLAEYIQSKGVELENEELAAAAADVVNELVETVETSEAVSETTEAQQEVDSEENSEK